MIRQEINDEYTREGKKRRLGTSIYKLSYFIFSSLLHPLAFFAVLISILANHCLASTPIRTAKKK